MELFNLHARVTPHFKGNFVEILDLIITPIPQNATFVSFCQIGSHMSSNSHVQTNRMLSVAYVAV